jgi:hypothetical protein
VLLVCLSQDSGFPEEGSKAQFRQQGQKSVRIPLAGLRSEWRSHDEGETQQLQLAHKTKTSRKCATLLLLRSDSRDIFEIRLANDAISCPETAVTHQWQLFNNLPRNIPSDS